jgi:hypothetical protein
MSNFVSLDTGSDLMGSDWGTGSLHKTEVESKKFTDTFTSLKSWKLVCTFSYYKKQEEKKDIYWVFGLCPSSGILEAGKHDVLETGSVSVLSWGGGRHLLCWVPYKELTSTPTLIGRDPTECLPPHLRMETEPVSEMLCFLSSRIPDDGQSPKTQ